MKIKKTEGGQGGKKGHSQMTHWTGTEEIKKLSKKARREQGKDIIRKAKFENFLESLKDESNDILIETVKTGFQACFENKDLEDANTILAKNLKHAPVKIKEYEAGGEKMQLPFWNPVGKVDKENCEEITKANEGFYARYEALELISDDDPRLSTEKIKELLYDSLEKGQQVKYVSHTLEDKEGYDAWGQRNPGSKLKMVNIKTKENWIHSTDPKLSKMNITNHWLFAFDGKQFVCWAN